MLKTIKCDFLQPACFKTCKSQTSDNVTRTNLGLDCRRPSLISAFTHTSADFTIHPPGHWTAALAQLYSFPIIYNKLNCSGAQHSVWHKKRIALDFSGALRQQPALIAAAIGTLHLLGFYLSTSPTSYLENMPRVGDPPTLPQKCAKVWSSTINSYMEKRLWVTR